MTKDMSEEKDIMQDKNILKNWMDRCKELESRLKEAEELNERFRQTYIQPDCQVNRMKETILSLKQRLSQAEAENEQLKVQQGMSVTFGGTMFNCAFEQDKKVKSLELRLSHLMDVAGKMAGALESLVNLCSIWKQRLPECSAKKKFEELPEIEQAKLALVEWDGIKDGGK